MSKEFPVPRFPILEFRIPKSVWHMQNLEYRTMRLGAAGAHMSGTWASRGPGVTGWDIECRRGDPGALLANPGAGLWAKEGRNRSKGERHTRNESMAN